MGWADTQGKSPDIDMSGATARSPQANGLSDQTNHPFHLASSAGSPKTSPQQGDALVLG